MQTFRPAGIPKAHHVGVNAGAASGCQGTDLDLEVEVKGKGVISEGTRPPHPVIKWILRLVGF